MLSRAELKRQAKEQMKGNLGKLLWCMLVYLVVILVVVMVFGLLMNVGIYHYNEAIVGIVCILYCVAMFVVIPPLMLGYFMVYLEATYNGYVEAGILFKPFKQALGKSIGMYLLVSIYTCLWALLFYIPGIVKSFSYSMSWFVLAENPHLSADEAITASRRIMNGHKWELFVLYLSFIPWYILSFVTFGIGFLYFIPYMTLTITNFYHNIKN